MPTFELIYILMGDDSIFIKPKKKRKTMKNCNEMRMRFKKIPLINTNKQFTNLQCACFTSLNFFAKYYFFFFFFFPFFFLLLAFQPTARLNKASWTLWLMSCKFSRAASLDIVIIFIKRKCKNSRVYIDFLLFYFFLWFGSRLRLRFRLLSRRLLLHRLLWRLWAATGLSYFFLYHNWRPIILAILPLTH